MRWKHLVTLDGITGGEGVWGGGATVNNRKLETISSGPSRWGG